MASKEEHIKQMKKMKQRVLKKSFALKIMGQGAEKKQKKGPELELVETGTMPIWSSIKNPVPDKNPKLEKKINNLE